MSLWWMVAVLPAALAIVLGLVKLDEMCCAWLDSRREEEWWK